MTIAKLSRRDPAISLSDTRISDPPSRTSPRLSAAADARALDRLAFTGPFVLVGTDNRPAGKPVGTMACAWDALDRRPDAVTIVGTLTPGLWGVDIDPTDRGADPWLGDRVAEQLAGWAESAGQRWLVRESGRAGGHHLIATVPDDHLADFRRACRETAARHGVAVTVRRTLRLLAAPHRLGLPAPVVAGNLTTVDLPIHGTCRAGLRAGSRQRPPRPLPQYSAPSGRPTDSSGYSGELDASDSGREFGRACYHARQGASAAQAWAAAGSCQVSDRGEAEWLRYIWLPAVTAVAAEQGICEPEAWARAVAACRVRTSQLGRDGWRAEMWEPALSAAADTARPRRLTPPRADVQRKHRPLDAADRAARDAEVAVLRRGLRAAAAHQLSLAGRRPQVAVTMTALLDAVAAAIVCDGGKISRRRAAVEAAIGDSTAKRRLREALEAGLIYRVATYTADAQPCDIYAPGPAAAAHITRARETGPRSCTPPLQRTLGSAHVPTLLARHTRERAQFASITEHSVTTETVKKTYGATHHPAARIVRSREHQRAWWRSLPADEQEKRRALCRTRLDALGSTERSARLDWLAERDLLDRAIDHVLAGTAVDHDHRVLRVAPAAVHHGHSRPTRPPARPDHAGSRPSPTGPTRQLELVEVGRRPGARPGGRGAAAPVDSSPPRRRRPVHRVADEPAGPVP